MSRLQQLDEYWNVCVFIDRTPQPDVSLWSSLGWSSLFSFDPSASSAPFSPCSSRKKDRLEQMLGQKLDIKFLEYINNHILKGGILELKIEFWFILKIVLDPLVKTFVFLVFWNSSKAAVTINPPGKLLLRSQLTTWSIHADSFLLPEHPRASRTNGSISELASLCKPIFHAYLVLYGTNQTPPAL